MSLKGGIGMLGIDHQHGRFGSDESGADPGVSGGQRRSAFRRTAPRYLIANRTVASALVILPVAHTAEENGEGEIRILSAKKATSRGRLFTAPLRKTGPPTA
jgi:hypothetical protein